MSNVPRVLGNRYEIGDLIGRGGMAQVHLGYDTRLSRTVAIKVLRTDLASDPMFLARFRREAQSAAALNHPSIVSVYDTGEELMTTHTGHQISLPYIVMEYVKGRTVASLLTSGDPVPISEAVQIVVGVLSALEYSHHEGIIHRDIKPGNVMITPAGKVKVMDFGIARAIADSAATMTQTNSVVGTAQYLSPEQARGEVVDARSDLYSTGCLLYELLTGKPPFTGDSAVAVAYQHVSETPKLASDVYPDIPDAVDRVVMKSLAKQRDERYQDAAEFRDDLLAAARGEGVAAPEATAWNTRPMTPPVPPTQVVSGPAGTQSNAAAPLSATGVQPAVMDEKTRRKNKMMIWLGVAFLAIAGMIIAYALASKNDDPDPKPTASSTAAKVPNLVGKTESEADKALKKEGLVLGKVTSVDDPSQDKGAVVSSTPKAGSAAKKGDRVDIQVATGNVEVPDVLGSTEKKAISKLEASGLTAEVDYQESKAAAGTVIAQYPEATSGSGEANVVKRSSKVSIIVATVPKATVEPSPQPTTDPSSGGGTDPTHQPSGGQPSSQPTTPSSPSDPTSPSSDGDGGGGSTNPTTQSTQGG